MSHTTDCDLLLCADDTCLQYQHKDLNQINKEVAKKLCNIRDWFVDNKVSVHFEEDKTKYTLSFPKIKKEN